MIRLPFFYPFENRRWPFFYFQSSWLVNNMPPWLVADFQYNPEYRNKFQFHRNALQVNENSRVFLLVPFLNNTLCFLGGRGCSVSKNEHLYSVKPLEKRTNNVENTK